jgi:hypothetical protein
MSIITQLQKDAFIANLDYLKQKVNSYGCDPKWSATVGDPPDGALTWEEERTAIALKMIDIAITAITWIV